MTIEDIKNICQIYDNLRRERDAATIAYNSEDAFWEHVLATYKLSQPSIHSNLDEAAIEYTRTVSHADIGLRPIPFNVNIKELYNRYDIRRSFKAGAQWMLNQLK